MEIRIEIGSGHQSASKSLVSGGPSENSRVLAGEAGVIHSNEPVHAGGQVVGRVRSGGFGYTLEMNIAYAYLPIEHARPGTEVSIEMFGVWVPALVQKEPLFDPKNERVKC